VLMVIVYRMFYIIVVSSHEHNIVNYRRLVSILH
jgi:hypothetical protein